MLEIRPNCERCDADLPPDAPAKICSFECTFCPPCAEGGLKGICPNCSGGFETRPVRPASLLEEFPPSTKRILKGAQ